MCQSKCSMHTVTRCNDYTEWCVLLFLLCPLHTYPMRMFTYTQNGIYTSYSYILCIYVLYQWMKKSHMALKNGTCKKPIHLLPTIVGKEYSISLNALHRHHTIRMGFTKLQRARDIVGPRICINESCGATNLATDPAGSGEPHSWLCLIHIFRWTSVLAEGVSDTPMKYL